MTAEKTERRTLSWEVLGKLKLAQNLADTHEASAKELVSDKLLVGSCCAIVQFFMWMARG